MILTLLRALPVMVMAVILSLVAWISIPIDRSGKTFHWSARTWAKFILWIYRIDVSVTNVQKIPKGHTVIYVSNHASWFDIPAVLASIPDEVRIVFKKELTKIPIWGWALKYGYYIPIDRYSPKDAMGSLEKAADRIRTGASVLLFAEGTRTRTGHLQPFKRGAFALAAKSGVPIVPLTINHSFGILPKGSIRVKRGAIQIVVGEPIDTSGVVGRDAERVLMEQVRKAITKDFVGPEELHTPEEEAGS